MAHVLLNNVDHHDLAVRPEPGQAPGEVTVFPTEFEALQREYPLLLRRDEGDGGGWRAVALLGLEADENLYLGADGRWQARSLPALVERGPFLIGMTEEGEPMIHLDLDDPRVVRGTVPGAAPLFLPHGGNAPYLDHVAGVLRRLHVGHGAAAATYGAWEDAGLIEPLTLQIPLDATLRYQLEGFHTVSEAALARLEGEALARLHAAGLFALAVHVASSLGNVQRLADAKRQRQRAAA